jgi:transposase-like protein
MLSKKMVDEIVRLLFEENVPQRAVARQLGVSRGTVHAIAHGRRTRRFAAEKAEEDPTPDVLALPERCLRCGYRVYLPCQVCRTRSHVARHGDRGRLARSA